MYWYLFSFWQFQKIAFLWHSIQILSFIKDKMNVYSQRKTSVTNNLRLKWLNLKVIAFFLTIFTKKNEYTWITGSDSRLYKFWVNFLLAKNIEGTIPRDTKKINNALHLKAYNLKNAFIFIISFIQYEIMIFTLILFFFRQYSIFILRDKKITRILLISSVSGQKDTTT